MIMNRKFNKEIKINVKISHSIRAGLGKQAQRIANSCMVLCSYWTRDSFR
jgi:hypothetical protein